MNIIKPEEARNRVSQGKGVLLDVRTSSEFETVHALEAVNVPLDKLDDVKHLVEKSNKEVYVICKSGQRSQMACKKLTQGDRKGIYTVDGGTLSWMQHNLDVIKGSPKWDLERQVRFVAGGLVFLGVILGYYVITWFYLLSAFVGLGLMFAAVTNTCAMGFLLMKLPYNKTKAFSLKLLEKVL